MADIKTRDRLRGTIKTIDKAYVEGHHMKRAYISTRDKAEHSTYYDEDSADEYASDRFEQGVDTAVHESVHLIDRAGRKGIDATKESIHKANDAVHNFKVKQSENALYTQTQSIGKTVRTAEKSAEKTIKQSARSAGNKTIKTVGKGSANAVQKSVKTAEQTAKTAIKTSQQAAKAAQQTAKAAAKAAKNVKFPLLFPSFCAILSWRKKGGPLSPVFRKVRTPHKQRHEHLYYQEERIHGSHQGSEREAAEGSAPSAGGRHRPRACEGQGRRPRAYPGL